MSYKILIVEDEPNMRLGLKDNLEFEGYTVELAENGTQGLELILNKSYDLFLLDVMMPGMSGLDVCKKAREKGVNTPILLLTAKSEEMDKVLGLELGATRAITIGRLSVNFEAYTSSNLSGPVRMSHKEYDILHYLFQQKNEIVTRYDLLQHVWGYEETPTTRTVDNFIVKLRQKIEDDPNDPKIIITVHGTGYKLIN